MLVLIEANWHLINRLENRPDMDYNDHIILYARGDKNAQSDFSHKKKK